MKVIVIGDGKVGTAIISHICKEGHDVCIVDSNPKVVEEMVNKYDVMGITGNGASYEILESAGADKADIAIAATSSDEVNILTCMIAKKLGTKETTARVRSYEYNLQKEKLARDFGIDLTINPEDEAAKEIYKVITFPEANRVDTFANGKVDLIELYIPENNQLIGKKLYEIQKLYGVKLLVCAVSRGNEVIIPDGSFVFQAKDKINVTARRGEIKTFLNKLGLIESKIKSILIIGGGRISHYLAEDLLKNKMDVKIIEKDYDRCLELSELLPGASIIHGDGTDQTVLNEEGINDCDCLVALTGIDEENIIISMYANKLGVQKIVTKVNNPSFASLIESIGVASVISPKEITAARMLRYIRATNNARGNNILTLYKIVNGEVEAIEFIAKENTKMLNVPLKDLKLKKKILIAGIIRDDSVIVPSGNDVIQMNDRVIVVSTNQFLDDLSDILE
ncbi:MAG: Trk system potassium transporter TrkA [Bacilli bacterium]|nr:Trk system potassium transporter TrkA [Bacilli bacterium]